MNYSIIENVLEAEDVDSIYSFLTVESPKDWWAYGVGYTDNNGFLKTQEVPQIFANNKGERVAMLNTAYEAFKKGLASYSYSKQMGNYPGKFSYHVEGCDCFICYSHEYGIFKPGGKFETISSDKLGKQVQIETIEWARYSSNDFYGERLLNPGQFGFSLFVTPGWNPLWGGNLVGWKQDHTLFNFDQKYNSLCLWDGMTAVTPVIPGLLNDCYVLTGTLVTKASE